METWGWHTFRNARSNVSDNSDSDLLFWEILVSFVEEKSQRAAALLAYAEEAYGSPKKG